MPFTSYAQNFEDVMLWRALKHIERGFYIDIGAQHPIIDSVSKAFYEKGWRGIHVEPVQYYADLLRADRPDETVLQLALADREGSLELNLIPETGLSTGVNSHAQRHQAERGLHFEKLIVPVSTIKKVFFDLNGKDIHWLKIDVEGFETQVLNGWDSRVLRPWIVVLEATLPNSSETDYAGWEPLLSAASYRFVYFDGLNRYYIAEEHPELAVAFNAPPNVFDDILLTVHSPICRELVCAQQNSEAGLHTHIKRLNEMAKNLEARTQQADLSTAQAEERATQAEERAAQAEERATQAEGRAAQAEQNLSDAKIELDALICSRSWRITRPLRCLNRIAQSLKMRRIE